MKIYRKDQGRMARMVAFWSLATLIFYGCHSLQRELTGRIDALSGALGGARIPVLGIDLTPAFLIATLVFAVSVGLLFRWHQQPRTADLLIDTESELRKVTWPSTPEVVNSSVVVIFCVIFLMAYLAGADWFLARIAQRLLIG